MRPAKSKYVHLFRPRVRISAGRVGELAAYLGLVVLVALSAVVAKELTARTFFEDPALAAFVRPLEVSVVDRPDTSPAPDPLAEIPLERESAVTEGPGSPWPQPSAMTLPEGAILDTSIRFFNGRPVRPVRQMSMLVTAYSPDWRSCGVWADGITASLHSVETNAGRLVAADRRVLGFGSMVSVPGYAGGEIVPVLDVGGKIKGARLDVLFPTHEVARRWGVRRLTVTVWDYADGQGAANWRAIRDSR
jgi:3D (Asp-Asp-Asp) domain-containing protein